MKGKLIKKNEHFVLFEGARFISTTDCADSTPNKLSLKNCQAIERGYDLGELAKEEFPLLDESWCRTGAVHEENLQLLGHRNSFQKGFQKALELLGDKKFSEEDVISMIEKSRETGLTAQYLILTKQQTEWDVTYNPDEKNSDGCLILKKI